MSTFDHPKREKKQKKQRTDLSFKILSVMIHGFPNFPCFFTSIMIYPSYQNEEANNKQMEDVEFQTSHLYIYI